MVIYFSGTGNSRYCAQRIAAALGDELLDAAGYIKHGIAADLISGKPWVFVSPTYAWRIPRVFEQFLRSGSFQGATDAYFVMTCGGDIGNAGKYLRALCGQIGLTYRGVLEVIMPENYVAMFAVPDEQESNEIIARAQPVLDAAVETIRRGEPFADGKGSLSDRFKSGSVNPAFYSLFVKAKKFYATDACVSCGLCQSACVLNNVHLTGGKPIWGENCTHCMACICGCPKEAIEYGRQSRGKRRYQCAAKP